VRGMGAEREREREREREKLLLTLCPIIDLRKYVGSVHTAFK